MLHVWHNTCKTLRRSVNLLSSVSISKPYSVEKLWISLNLQKIANNLVRTGRVQISPGRLRTGASRSTQHMWRFSEICELMWLKTSSHQYSAEKLSVNKLFQDFSNFSPDMRLVEIPLGRLRTGASRPTWHMWSFVEIFQFFIWSRLWNIQIRRTNRPETLLITISAIFD